MTTDLFHWSDEFSVGLQEIDEQHKELVDLLNQLHTAIQEHHGSATSRQILDNGGDRIVGDRDGDDVAVARQPVERHRHFAAGRRRGGTEFFQRPTPHERWLDRMARQTESQRLCDASGADDAELFYASAFHGAGLARTAMLRQYRYALRRGCKGAQSALQGDPGRV